MAALGDRRATIAEIDETLLAATHFEASDVHTVVLTAGPGAGKTYTLRWLTDRLRGVQVRFAAADELSWRQPYAVAAGLLGHPVPDVVVDGYGDDLYAEVDAICSRAPQVFVLDDAHNADAASLSLLTRLAGAAGALPLILVIARRHLPARDLITRLLARPGVREWALPPMDAGDLDELCESVTGAPPADALRATLATSGGNPMHAKSMLDMLLRTGRVAIRDGRASADGADAVIAQDTREVVAEHLSLLQGPAVELIQKMAVWGRPATLVELAGLDNSRPAKLVAAAQTAVDAGVITADDAGTLAFSHDLYAEVTYHRLAPPLRSVLHRAIADHYRVTGVNQLVAHHLVAAGADDDEVADAVRRAAGELDSAPGVAADLLDTVAATHSSTTPASIPTTQIDLAHALARTGQLSRAAAVATEGLRIAPDIETIAELQRILFFVLIIQGRTDEVRTIVDDTLALPLDAPTVAALTDVRHYVDILDVGGAVPPQPFFDAAHEAAGRSMLGLMAEALRRFLRGDADSALQLALLASRRHEQRSGLDNVIGSSADIWPSLIEGYLHGPAASADLLAGATKRRVSAGSEWVTSYQTFTRGGIELASGRFDDAAASFDAGFELVAAADMSWTSMAVGGRALVDVWRGDFASATERLTQFAASDEPDQFGLPIIGRARALLLEARRQLRPAADVALDTWSTARSREVFVWLPSFALDAVRIGMRAGRADLVDAVGDGLADMPVAPTPVSAGPRELAMSLASAYCAGTGVGASGELVDIALRVADAAEELGDVITTVCAGEEAACLAAASGDRVAARRHAYQALARIQEMGATAMSARLASRLRTAGVRVDPHSGRRRPRTGWDSLTRTEQTVANLVAAGRNGPEIADELFVSTRTVQTHVSHALAKLGLRTRVDLAAYVTSQQSG